MTIAKILVVEDEFLIRLTLSEALTDEGFLVVEAASADEALSIWDRTDRISLVLTDIQLPGKLDGQALVRKLRQQQPNLAVIYVTGRPNAMGPLVDSSREIFIAKPYLPSEVCAAARRLIQAE